MPLKRLFQRLRERLRSPSEPLDERGAMLVRGYRLTVAAALALVALHVVNEQHVATLWDDAWMFQRYANNLLRGGGLAWNPHGPPTYGLTSLLFVLPGAIGRALLHNSAKAAMTSSVAFGVTFVLLAFRLLDRAAAPAVARAGKAALALGLATSSSGYVHFVSGMDTTFAMSYVALLGLCGVRLEEGRRGSGWQFGAVAAIAFWVRPELAAYALLVPAAIALTARERRRAAIGAAAIGAAGLAIILVVNELYFKSALPLPYYGKLHGYDPHFREMYRGQATRELADYLFGYWPLLVPIALEVGMRPVSWWKSADGCERALAIAGFGCIAGYWAFVLPIMGYNSRLYYPAAPALAFVATRCIGRLAARFDGERAALAMGALSGLGLAWLMLFPKLSDQTMRAAETIAKRRFGYDVFLQAKDRGVQQYWARIDAVTALPDDVVLATTEVGFLGVLNPDKVVIDMAGLNERAFGLAPFDAGVLIDQMRPDVIYLPHPDYEAMTNAILAHPHFKDGYDNYPKSRFGSRFGVAVRRASPRYPEINAAIGGFPRQNGAPAFMQ